jgi:hypothetical protein
VDATGIDAGARPAERDVLSLPVLLLNRHFAPVTVATAKRAMCLLYGGAAHAVDQDGDTYDFSDWLSLPVRDVDDGLPIIGREIRVPRVLHLLRYERTPRAVVRLTRRNLMPRSRGGADSWENLVVSCRFCNLKKGRRTPQEAGMTLLRAPQRPRWSTATQILLVARTPYEEWDPFLKAG